MTCSHCVDAEDFFGRRTAKRDLRRYRRKGPHKSTQLLLEAIGPAPGPGATLLDIGGGVGAIQHELLQAGFVSAVQVEASEEYLKASQSEASRLGLRDRVAYFHGDFVDMAPTIAEADVVTLDRVICCYPQMERLVERSAAKAKLLFGLVFPRERSGARLGVSLANLFFRARRSAFRVYLHPSAAVDAALRRIGFRQTFNDTTLLWQVAVYSRVPPDR
jgi:hypothetical protein